MSDEEYSPLKYSMYAWKSHWKVCVSDKKMRSGLYCSEKDFSANRFLFKPSMFHDMEISLMDASVVTELSEAGSLNDPDQFGHAGLLHYWEEIHLWSWKIHLLDQ